MADKVLIIGIDGGTWTVLKPAMEEGYMPFLKSLVDTGASGILESTIPAITPAAWGSFQTGMNPGESGVHDFFQWDKKTKKATIVNSTNLKETIWDAAGRAGRRVGVVNVPMTWPPKKINGYMITGLLTPSLESEFTFPPQLKNELLEAVGDYEILNLERAARNPSGESFYDYVQQMVVDLRCKADAAEFTIAKEPLDLFMVHFQAVDLIQHQFWGYLTEGHPQYDPQKRQYLLEHFYGQLDQQMQRVHKAFWNRSDSNGLTFVVSDHGFGANNIIVNLSVWLQRHGYLKVNFAEGGEKPLLKKVTSKLRIGKLLSHLIRKETISQMEASVLRIEKGRYQWAKSKAYPSGGNSEGFIYLLDEKEKKRSITERRIIKKLQKLKDPAGHCAVKTVYRKTDIFHGGNTDILPDLVIEPQDGYSFDGAYRPDVELFRNVDFQEDIHKGKHHKDGIIVACGEGIVPQGGMRAAIVDIAPTVLYAMSLPVRRDCDGGIINGLFSDDFRTTLGQPSFYDVRSSSDRQTKEYDANEQKCIEDRLKDLGYL